MLAALSDLGAEANKQHCALLGPVDAAIFSELPMWVPDWTVVGLQGNGPLCHDRPANYNAWIGCPPRIAMTPKPVLRCVKMLEGFAHN